MKTVYLVRQIGGPWRRQFKTLDEAIEFAKTDPYMMSGSWKVVVEKITTERVWDRKEGE